MSFFFNRRQKSAQDVVRGVKDGIQRLETLGSTADKKRVQEEVARSLQAMKVLLYGDGDADPVPDQVTQLSQQVYQTDLLYLFVVNFGRLEFESRKDVASIFNVFLRRQIGTRYPTVDYLATKEDTLFILVRGYQVPEIALHSGLILRECFKHELLAKIVLWNSVFWEFFGYVESGTFDIASDAFQTFKELITRHKNISADFLQNNYDNFFQKYTDLLKSSNYVTKRQSIKVGILSILLSLIMKLLGEILLGRSNFNIMTTYIQSSENLKLIMNLLRDRSRNIQFEAFHVFKVFVANPNKTKQVLNILMKNKDKLLIFLSNFHNDRKDDEQFNDEKAFLIKQIEAL
ncbi:uncharacterized protein T551_01723 [Pneumocystis jirovecii RU7]|uniref:Calcium-binding protein 39 n=1 Tax=Pneumocystis jirovecii (strain RU7) TaxID=1408657 RepID=A0A0W4ZPY9_PNEJ7|nr:uncharacterized protein T551_01723 [Pneumocystis jirovecii RU7]KTW30440.1 hypothetical protein T551_01723 [Pneumocystis jirovecii RU7]